MEAPGHKHMHYNPVQVREVLGTLALSLLSLILLIALLCSEARYRKLLEASVKQ